MAAKLNDLALLTGPNAAALRQAVKAYATIDTLYSSLRRDIIANASGKPSEASDFDELVGFTVAAFDGMDRLEPIKTSENED